MSEKKTCGGTVFAPGAFSGYRCGLGAKFERDGKWYCGTHDPVSVAEKRAKRDAAWFAERQKERELREVTGAARKETQRRAECFPDLLAALIALYDRNNSDNRIAAHAAIAKATGSAS